MRVHFSVNALKPEAKAARRALAAEAARLGVDVASADRAEVIVALGGDGTILRAVHAHPGLPVLGLNLGGLGYLACVGESDFAAALALLAAGRYRISERTMLSVRKAGSRRVAATALNDVVIVREMSGHAARLDVAVDGRLATRYMADGLIFATPTGSTAYSLAAGGPVLMPDSQSVVVTPMSPHALGVRPLVVRETAAFTVTSRPRANGNTTKTGVYADGRRVFLLGAGDAAEITKAPVSAKLVELDGYEPYDVLARKLGWSGTNLKTP